jgi:Ca2+-binding RTX toxin-like protein
MHRPIAYTHHFTSTALHSATTERICIMAFKYGTNYSEYLSGTDSDDYIYGYGGNDTLDGFNGVDVMNGGDGDDWVYGGRGNDTLYGGNGSDHLYGQQDNDRFMGAYDGAGDDFFYGDDGYDTVDYSGATGGVVIGLKQGHADSSAYGRDMLYGIENAIGGDGSDIIHGTEAGLFGLGGENVLEGRGGNDWISGKSGNDTLYGGTGVDTLYGDDGNDKLYGEADADYMYGGYGNDKLYGGAGDDVMFGGLGDDAFDGGDGYDTVNYRDAADGVAITFDGEDQYLMAQFVGSSLTEGVDSFVNVEKVLGSRFGDFIHGDGLGTSDNFIDGGDGNDWLYGDHPSTAAGFYGGNDVLIGGNGNDMLEGNVGADILSGGAGSDRFFYENFDSGVGAGNRDTITDFQQGSDWIAFYTAGTPMSFVGQAAFTSMGQLRYAYEGNDTIVQVNLDFDATAEMEIQLTGHLALAASSFEFLGT